MLEQGYFSSLLNADKHIVGQFWHVAKTMFDNRPASLWKQAQRIVPVRVVYLLSEEGINTAWSTGKFDQPFERRENYLNEWHSRLIQRTVK